MRYNRHDNKNDNYIPGLDKMPALLYLKDPVATISELYSRYPDGGEYGWYAFVTSKATFAAWNIDTKRWELINPGDLQQMLGVDPEELQEGDIPVWDPEEEKFVIINLSVIGENEY